MATIEFLYSTDCPSHRFALELLREVLAEERVANEIRMIPVDSEEQAHHTHFPGSRTIRVGGCDVEGGQVPPVGFTCWTYRHSDGTVSPVPAKESIRRAVLSPVEGTERPA